MSGMTKANVCYPNARTRDEEYPEDDGEGQAPDALDEAAEAGGVHVLVVGRLVELAGDERLAHGGEVQQQQNAAHLQQQVACPLKNNAGKAAECYYWIEKMQGKQENALLDTNNAGKVGECFY